MFHNNQVVKGGVEKDTGRGETTITKTQRTMTHFEEMGRDGPNIISSAPVGGAHLAQHADATWCIPRVNSLLQAHCHQRMPPLPQTTASWRDVISRSHGGDHNLRRENNCKRGSRWHNRDSWYHNCWCHCRKYDVTRLLFSNICLPGDGIEMPVNDIPNPREARAHDGG